MRRLLLLLVGLTAACDANQQSTSHPESAPDAAAGKSVAAAATYEVSFAESVVQTKTGPMRVWMYAPDPMPKSVGLVVVAPAGSNLITGMTLGEGDRPEHEPYVRHGYVVVSFDISGALSDDASDADAMDAVVDFADARVGVLNAQAALDAALESYPNIDPSRVFAAGHSSAGTLALTFAALEPRVKAVAAYAAPVDVVGTVGSAIVNALDSVLPGYRDLLTTTSPISYATSLAEKPVFLFHAEDDAMVPATQTQQLFEAMTERHSASIRKTTPSGGHYDPMLSEGIPMAIRWFDALQPS